MLIIILYDPYEAEQMYKYGTILTLQYIKSTKVGQGQLMQSYL